MSSQFANVGHFHILWKIISGRFSFIQLSMSGLYLWAYIAGLWCVYSMLWRHYVLLRGEWQIELTQLHLRAISFSQISDPVFKSGEKDLLASMAYRKCACILVSWESWIQTNLQNSFWSALSYLSVHKSLYSVFFVICVFIIYVFSGIKQRSL